MTTMKILVSGHRLHKLQTYDIDWIKKTINTILSTNSKLESTNLISESGNNLIKSISVGYSGMAGGVDLWFCQSCLDNNIPFIACPPFEEQGSLLSEMKQKIRNEMLLKAKEILKVRNSFLVEKVDCAIVVFDGQKGGTHNVFQQLIEKQKPFIWLNPVSEKVWECF